MGGDQADPGLFLSAGLDGASTRRSARLVLDGIVFRLRSGCQWSQLLVCFGASSTVRGWFQRFSADGFLEELWAYLVRECEELGEVHWEWQAIDGVMGKSRHEGGARGPNPTDRAKMEDVRIVVELQRRSSPG